MQPTGGGRKSAFAFVRYSHVRARGARALSKRKVFDLRATAAAAAAVAGARCALNSDGVRHVM